MEQTLRTCDDRTDAELLSGLTAGDETASTALYRRHHRLVRSTSHRIIRDPDLADDVTQDVFIEFLRLNDRVDLARGSVPSLLKTMARRRSIDKVRYVESCRRREQRCARSERCVTAIATEVVEKDTAAAVRKAVDELPAPQRAVIDLAFWHDRTHRQIALDLQLPEGTVKSRMRSALHRLRATSRALGDPAAVG